MFKTLVRNITQWSSVQPTFISTSPLRQVFQRRLHLFECTTMPRRKRAWRNQRDQGAAQLGPHMAQFKRGSDARPKRKYYAVRYGLDGFSGVLTSWDECRLYVSGVPNAKFKSFKTLDEAQCFLRSPPKRNGETASQPVASDIQDECDDLQVLEATDPPSDAPEYMEVYTDGACTKNGRIGSRAGYGVYFGEDNPYNVSEPLIDEPTNQRAEMTAVIEALQIIRQHGLVAKNGEVKIYSDSKYTINGMDSWLPGWRKSNWKTASGSPVKNKQLWIAIESNRRALLTIGIKVVMVWVKSHVGIPGNEAADRLAVSALSRAP